MHFRLALASCYWQKAYYWLQCIR